MNEYGGIGTMGGVASLVIVLVVVAVLVLVAWGLHALFPGMDSTTRAEPLDALNQRYAVGEINSAEDEQARRAIE